MIRSGRLNESDDREYDKFKKDCQNNSTYKKCAAICKKYGYELAPLCYVEEGKTGKKYITFGIMMPGRNSYLPEIRYSRDRFLIQTTAYGSLEISEYADFLKAVTAAQKMVEELSKVDLTKLNTIPLED